MTTVGYYQDCPRCKSEKSAQVEQRYSEYLMECCNCGYYEEGIGAYFYKRCKTTIFVPQRETLKTGIREVSGQCIEYSDKKLLDGFKLDPYSGDYIRKGVIQKTDGQQGKYLMFGGWFSSPTFISFKVEWYEDPTSWDFPTRGDGWVFHPEK